MDLIYEEQHHHHHHPHHHLAASNNTVNSSTLKRSFSLPKFNGNNSKSCNNCSEYQLTQAFTNDYITVVDVEEDKNDLTMDNNSDDFITVLEVDSKQNMVNNNDNDDHQMATIIEQVTVYRLPGERLGMALKFEGGANCDETIDNLFIQNINPESPSSRIQGSVLEKLKEGDELLEIDGRPVNTMTRIECVAALKEVPVCFKMLIRRQEMLSQNQLINAQNTALMNGSVQRIYANNNNNNIKSNNRLTSTSAPCTLQRPKRGPPPPVPTRMPGTSLTSGNQIKQSTKSLSIKKRPSQPPPLPPRRPKESSSSSSSSSASILINDVSPLSMPLIHSSKNNYNNNVRKKNLGENSYRGDKMAIFDQHIDDDSEIIDVNQNDYRNYDSSDSWLLSSQKVNDNNCPEMLSLPVNLVYSTNGFRKDVQSVNCSYNDNHEHNQDYPNQTIVNNNSIECLPAPQEFGDFIESKKTMIESESDDTSSSVSTIIERFSCSTTANTSFSESNCNSSPSSSPPPPPTPLRQASIGQINGNKLNIGIILDPFEKLERELDHKTSLKMCPDQVQLKKGEKLISNDEKVTTNGHNYNSLNGTQMHYNAFTDVNYSSKGSNLAVSLVSSSHSSSSCSSSSSSSEGGAGDAGGRGEDEKTTITTPPTMYDINLDDYDDIQSVSMSYDVNNYCDSVADQHAPNNNSNFSNHFDSIIEEPEGTSECDSDLSIATVTGHSHPQATPPLPPPPPPPPHLNEMTMMKMEAGETVSDKRKITIGKNMATKICSSESIDKAKSDQTIASNNMAKSVIDSVVCEASNQKRPSNCNEIKAGQSLISSSTRQAKSSSSFDESKLSSSSSTTSSNDNSCWTKASFNYCNKKCSTSTLITPAPTPNRLRNNDDICSNHAIKESVACMNEDKSDHLLVEKYSCNTGKDKIININSMNDGKEKINHYNKHKNSPISTSLIPKICESRRRLSSSMSSSTLSLSSYCNASNNNNSHNNNNHHSNNSNNLTSNKCNSNFLRRTKSTLSLSAIKKDSGKPSLIPRPIWRSPIQSISTSNCKLNHINGSTTINATKIPVRRCKSIGNMKSIFNSTFNTVNGLAVGGVTHDKLNQAICNVKQLNGSKSMSKTTSNRENGKENSNSSPQSASRDLHQNVPPESHTNGNNHLPKRSDDVFRAAATNQNGNPIAIEIIPNGRTKIIRDTFERVRKNSENSNGLKSGCVSDDDFSSVSSRAFTSSSIKADDSASDATYDSFERNVSPENEKSKSSPTVDRLTSNCKKPPPIEPRTSSESVRNFKALLEKWEKGFVMTSNNSPNNINNNDQYTSVPNLSRSQSSTHQTPPPPLPKPRGVMRVQSVDSVRVDKCLTPTSCTKSSSLVKDNRLIKELLPETSETEDTNFYREDRFSSSCRNISKTNNDHWTSLPCQQEMLSCLSQSESDVPCKNVKMSLQDNLVSAKTLLTNGHRCAITKDTSVSVSDIRRVFENQISSNKSSPTSPLPLSASFSRERSITDIDQQQQQQQQQPLQEQPSQNDSTKFSLSDILYKPPEQEEDNEDSISKDKKEEDVKCPGDTSENPASIESSEQERVVFRTNHSRVLSTDSTASDSGNSSPEGNSDRANCNSSSIGSRSSSVSNLRDSQFGSVTSLASTTSLISPQELQALIDEANQSLEGEVYNQNTQIQVIVLHREYNTTGSIGITLAGGSDYETKEIIVHKVIKGSIADRDGRIKKGDRVLSINGKIMKGITHKEALKIMKSPRPEVVIVTSRSSFRNENSSDYYGLNGNGFGTLQSGDSLGRLRGDLEDVDTLTGSNDQYKIIKAALIKDGAGLGFILEGGRDSVYYHREPGDPVIERGRDKLLSIKRIFKGGPADKEGTLWQGDELLMVNDTAAYNMTRTEAWNHLKKLPDGVINITARRRVFA